MSVPIPNTAATFTLADATALYHRQVDQTHKYWNYLSIISFGTITVSGTANGRNLGTYLLAAFVVFAVVNAILIYSGQKETRNTATAVKNFLKNSDQTVSKEFKEILLSISVWPEWLAFVGHLLMDAAVIYCVYKLALA
jgi:hypothetical protein